MPGCTEEVHRLLGLGIFLTSPLPISFVWQSPTVNLRLETIANTIYNDHFPLSFLGPKLLIKMIVTTGSPPLVNIKSSVLCTDTFLHREIIT